MIGEIHLYDAGVQFIVTIHDENDAAVDISTVTSSQLIFQKPDSSSFTVNAPFLTDGTDGNIYYTTSSTDLDQIGLWRLQVILTYPGSNIKRSDLGSFRIYRNLPTL